MFILLIGSMSYECVSPMINRSNTLFMEMTAYHIHALQLLMHFKAIFKCFVLSKPLERQKV